MNDEVIQLTPPGAAAIAVVRIVGQGVCSFLASHFSRQAVVDRAVHGELRDGAELIDDPVIVLSEDQLSADINLHGGPWVVEATLQLAEKCGFARVTPSIPLVAIAVDAETELDREIQQYLPLAKTELALRTLLAQKNAWAQIKTDPNRVSLSWVEACLSDPSLDHLLNPPTIAIVGIPNAGKSTLANRIFATDRSIVADLPGTTRDWVEELANIDGLPVRLMDMPGLRQTTDTIEAAAIARAVDQLKDVTLKIILLDVTQAFEPQQRELVERFAGALVVVNKVDQAVLWTGAELDGIRISASLGHGVDDLLGTLFQHFAGSLPSEFDVTRARCWTHRQRDILRQCLSDPQRVKSL